MFNLMSTTKQAKSQWQQRWKKGENGNSGKEPRNV